MPNETKSFICGGSNSVHMDVPTQVTGDIQPQVPGTADNLRARLAKRREILIFPRTVGNTGNSREILVIPGNYWEIGNSPTIKL